MWLSCALLACSLNAQEALTVRVLPRPLATNREPFRIGLQMGFPEGPAGPLRAECLAGGAVTAETNIAVETAQDLNTGKPVYRVSNSSARAGGIAVESAPLRKSVGYTVRLRCRPVRGRATVRFRFTPVGATEHEATEKAAAVKGDGLEIAFAVRPHTDGAYRCEFRVGAGEAVEVAAFSMQPDDAVAGWSRQALDALRAVGPGAVRWPADAGLACYNWYQGVGPLALRQAPGACPPSSVASGFGTAEFVQFCRLIQAEPQLRVIVPTHEKAGVDAAQTQAGVQRAADWAAYCNAPSNEPLARLRMRHGFAEPLGVRRWEVAAPEGEVFAGVLHDYRAALQAAGQTPGLCVVGADPPLAEVHDRTVAEVMRRLAGAAAAEREYYAEWYGALSVVNDALSRLRGGGGIVFSPYAAEQLLKRSPGAKGQLAERGQLIALFNRFPACVPLVTEGAPGSPQAPLQVVAAWTEDPSALVVYLYNSDPETRRVRVDLTAMRRRFAFWASDQLAADLAARRTLRTVPLLRRQRAGSALPQAFLCECLPASFTRVVVKE